MEALRLMIPKKDVTILYDISKFAEGLGIFRACGYSAIPVLTREGEFAGVVSDKDFLNVYTQADAGKLYHKLQIRDIMQREKCRSINVNADIDEVLLQSMEQNFISVVDDMNQFIGIITRREIINYLKENTTKPGTYEIIGREASAEEMALAINELERKSTHMEMFFTMYEAGMREICNRLEIINEWLAFKYNREPLQQLTSRLKDSKSIMGKLARKNLPPTMDAMRTNLFDIAGVRVICSYVEDVYAFADYLTQQKDLSVLVEKDYIKNPKPNGYRSLHLVVTVPVYFLEAVQLVPVEIQFRTELMDYWASLEHDLKYKPVYNHTDVDISEELLEISDELDRVEGRMQNLAKLLNQNQG